MRKVLLSVLSVVMALGIQGICAQSRSDDFADSLAASHKIIYMDGEPYGNRTQAHKDSLHSVISTFYYDQFRHFQDPEAPYFLFMSKDAKLTMGMGGAVRMRGYYDWGGAIPASGFAPYLIPMESSTVNERQFGTTPAGTCLFFRVLGRNRTIGNFQLYIEANFNGYQSRDFLLKKAYAIVNDFTIGYASSTFADPAAIAPTVDAQGPNNKISPTAVLVRYMPVLRDRWVFAVSAETPDYSIDADGVNTERVSAWLPDFAAFVQYQWGRSQHVRLSGIIRTIPYRNCVEERNRNVVGWGVQLSSVAHPWNPVTTYVTVNYGKGYESLGGDLLIGRYDLVGKPGNPGELYAPGAFGWSVAVQYNFCHNLFATLVASQSRYLPSGSVDPSEYKTGLFAAANVFWYITPRTSVGLEFDWGLRRNFDGEQRSARRIGAMCQFAF